MPMGCISSIYLPSSSSSRKTQDVTSTQHRRPKFSLQNSIMDFTSKIRHIMGSVVCETHQARVEEPCWWISTDTPILRAAICGNRASKMYTGQVSASSFNRRNGSLSNKNKNANRYPKKENTR